jgi:hypothetical protein
MPIAGHTKIVRFPDSSPNYNIRKDLILIRVRPVACLIV